MAAYDEAVARLPSRHNGAVRNTPRTPEEFFAGHELGLAAFEKLSDSLRAIGPFEVRVSRSQVALRRRRGFAYLWLPGQYLKKPTAEVVLTIALGRAVESPRFKEVAHPSSAEWMHHLEIHALSDLDEEVETWLREAAERAT